LTAQNEKSEINATSPFLSSHAIAPPKFKLKYSSSSETFFNLQKNEQESSDLQGGDEFAGQKYMCNNGITLIVYGDSQ